jgi:hypothetical protein
MAKERVENEVLDVTAARGGLTLLESRDSFAMGKSDFRCRNRSYSASGVL